MLGRSNGYSEGAVVYDSRLECRQPGIECGAFIEVWEDPADARASSEYTKALQNGMQSLGTEYHYLQDGTLIRVWGDLSPKQAKEYEAAIGD